MSKLWVPPRVSSELEDSTARFNTEVKEQMRFRGPVCAAWNPELQKIDPYLRLAKAVENANFPGVRAGFYHLIRLNPTGPVWVQPITGPDGEFTEPSSGMLDLLRASDLQNPRAVLARKREDERREQARRDAEAEQDEERREEMLERWASATQTRVSMTDVPWSQNVAGRKKAA